MAQQRRPGLSPSFPDMPSTPCFHRSGIKGTTAECGFDTSKVFVRARSWLSKTWDGRIPTGSTPDTYRCYGWWAKSAESLFSLDASRKPEPSQCRLAYDLDCGGPGPARIMQAPSSTPHCRRILNHLGDHSWLGPTTTAQSSNLVSTGAALV